MAKRQSSQTSDASYFTRLGIEVELQRIEERAAQLRAWLGRLPSRAAAAVRRVAGADGTSSAAPSTRRRRMRTMSTEARKRISDAQKARWAKQKGEVPSTEAAPAEGTAVAAKGKPRSRGVRKAATKRGRRQMSAAARKRISDAQKKRWAARRNTA
jgi:hypothetical protein